MKQAISIALAALVVACAVVQASPRYVAFEIKAGTNTTQVLTDTERMSGYVDEIYIQTPTTNGTTVKSGIVTAQVLFAVSPNIATGLGSTRLYTNKTFTTAIKARPRVAQTDNTGTNLSSLTVAERFLCVGDPMVLTVKQITAATNVVYKGWIKVDDK